MESLPLEELDGILQDIYFGRYPGMGAFKRSLREIKSSKNPGEKLRHLRVIGDADPGILEHFERAGIPRGFYLNADGSWMLIVLPENPHLGEYFSRCGKNLESLWLWNTQSYTRDWTKMPVLRSVDLRDNPLLDTAEGLGTLTELKELTISDCPQLVMIEDLHKLTRLTRLSIWSCSQLAALPGLENLTQLTWLYLYRCSSLTALPRLENLTQLTKLDLTKCSSLTALPGLENLTQLTELYLSGCSSLTALPGLENLTQLTKLDLSGCDSLTVLPGLENLTQLTSLNLSLCGSLTALLGLENLTQLYFLNLSGCSSLKELPDGIRRSQNLLALNLNHMHLLELPDWLPEIADRFATFVGPIDGGNKAAVTLYKTTVDAIPDMSIFDQPYEMIVDFFRKRKLGEVHPLNEIKVVFLGDGEAGKSHTIARLMNDGGEPDHAIFDGQSTPGIVIRNKEYDLGDRKITVHYWDFGGQEIMHSMHRIFLTGRTMYVILLNARDDTQSDRAKYWLHNVQSFAKDAPVLLVLNKIDQNPNASVDKQDLHSRYDKLTQVVRLSAKDFPQEQFNDCFTRVLLEEIQKTGFLDAQWPTAWTKVKEKLENMETHYITGDDYEDICHDCQVDENQENLLLWFNDLGISFCCRDAGDYALKDYVILRPDWITNALYIILFNTLEGANNGLIPHSSIFNILSTAHKNPAIRRTLLNARYSSGDIQYVLGIMRKFSLSFTDGHENEFIPMLCQQNSTVDIQYYHKDEDTLEFNMVFDYLPNNLLHRLMVERHQELDMDNVWRTGARFEIEELGYSAVVLIDGNTLRFFIRHTDPMHLPNTYLAMLKANVDKIVRKMGINAPKCKLVYKVHGKQAVFSYDRLLKLHARGRREEYCEALDEDFPIADILNQSAPAASADLNTLLDSMISAGLHLQGNKNYRGWDENGRNSVVRDSLGDKGYIVLDQNLRGTSETGKSYGELDLLIQRVPNRPWVLCEALIAGGYTNEWNKHLDKLLNEYNPHGLPFLFLLTYVDCGKSQFDGIWKKYMQHICEDAPKSFARMPETVELDLHREYEYIKIARCSYRRDSYTPVVYHIFVQMDPRS